MTKITHLPVELIYEIHLLALNPDLAPTCTWIYDTLHTFPCSLRAHWLLLRHESLYRSSGTKLSALHWVVEFSLKHPVCTADVIKIIPKVYEMYDEGLVLASVSTAVPDDNNGKRPDLPVLQPREMDFISLPKSMFSNICICDETDTEPGTCAVIDPSHIKGRRTMPSSSAGSDKEMDTQSRRSRKVKTVQEVLNMLDALDELSRAPFPSYTAYYATLASSPPPDTASPSLPTPPPILKIHVNSHAGSPLILCSAFGAHRLVRRLLDMGAKPTSKDGMAVRCAIRRKDLKLVRMLVERGWGWGTGDSDGKEKERDFEVDVASDSKQRKKSVSPPSGLSLASKAKANSSQYSSSSNSKRRRLSDRVEINPIFLAEAMRFDARSIVDYFVRERGCSVDIRVLGKHFFSSGSS